MKSLRVRIILGALLVTSGITVAQNPKEESNEEQWAAWQTSFTQFAQRVRGVVDHGGDGALQPFMIMAIVSGLNGCPTQDPDKELGPVKFRARFSGFQNIEGSFLTNMRKEKIRRPEKFPKLQIQGEVPGGGILVLTNANQETIQEWEALIPGAEITFRAEVSCRFAVQGPRSKLYIVAFQNAGLVK